LEHALVDLLPQGLLRAGPTFRPVQEQIGGLKHPINGAFPALAQLAMLWFIAKLEYHRHQTTDHHGSVDEPTHDSLRLQAVRVHMR
jgi:hypothetical protein